VETSNLRDHAVSARSEALGIAIAALCATAGADGGHASGTIGCDPTTASFFLGREDPVPSLRPELSRWQERIYAFMTRNAVRAPDYFLIPPQQVVELGTKVEL
jgi:K+ transporter